jgi:hypothetical protein
MLHARGDKYQITKYEGYRPLGVPTHTWEDNIKIHPKTRDEDMDFVYLPR